MNAIDIKDILVFLAIFGFSWNIYHILKIKKMEKEKTNIIEKTIQFFYANGLNSKEATELIQELREWKER